MIPKDPWPVRVSRDQHWFIHLKKVDFVDIDELCLDIPIFSRTSYFSSSFSTMIAMLSRVAKDRMSHFVKDCLM